MENYQCRKCGTVIQSSSYPSSSGCRAQGTTHNWAGLGQVGSQNYQCNRCGIVIQASSYPGTGGCQAHGTTHNWNKL